MIRYGVSGHGPEVVLLHGVGLDGTMWDRCAPRLARGYTLVVPDLRGHGKSPPATSGTELSDLAGDVARIVGDGAHVVGFSLGAMVAEQLALDWPQKVASLTLVSAIARRSDTQTEAALDRLRLVRSDFPAVVAAAVDRWFSQRWRSAEPALVDSVRATLMANDVESYRHCYRVFATADAYLWPRLAAVTCPTLAITGADDPMSTPAMTRALADRIPSGRDVVIPGARHLLPLERPAELVAALEDFLDTAGSG